MLNPVGYWEFKFGTVRHGPRSSRTAYDIPISISSGGERALHMLIVRTKANKMLCNMVNILA